MDQEMRQRLEAVEARLTDLENRPIAVARKKANRRERTPEEKAEKGRQLRAGKEAARKRRAAEAEAKLTRRPGRPKKEVK